MDVLQIIVKFVYKIGKFSLEMNNIDLERGFITDPAEDKRRLQRVFTTDSNGPCRDKRNRSVLASSGGKQDSGLQVAKVLLFPR